MLRIFRPLPRAITRPLSILALVAWVVTMGVMINRSYLQASSRNLATDLARYGITAQWRGVYYRGEKIGFTVSQVQATDDGFELQEDGRLQFSLLGANTAAILRTTASVDRAFVLQSFDFSLDPGTGPTSIKGQLDGLKLSLEIGGAAGHADGNTPTGGTAGADAERRPPAGQRRTACRNDEGMDRLRSGDHEERAGDGSRSASVKWSGRRAARRSRRSRWR